MKHERIVFSFMAAVAVAVLVACPPSAHAQIILYDNGPLVTHSDNCSPDDASRLQTNLGMNTLGFGHQLFDDNHIADDFTVPEGGWDIDSITFFAYQTGAARDNSTITGLYVQIWDGPPSDNGSSIVWGDLVTNRLSSTEFSGIQRDSYTSTCADNRWIFANTADVDVDLPAGTYWVEWMTDGDLSSGPWAPPVTILGQTSTGNALQYTGTWAAAQDSGTLTPQDFPFIIMGPPECELFIQYNSRKIRAERLFKPRRVALNVTGGEGFDIFGEIDLGPIQWRRVMFKQKRNRLRILAIVPAGLEPQIIPVSVGDCYGEIEITGDMPF